MKLVALVPVPEPFVTEIGPLVAPTGTRATILAAERRSHQVAAFALNLTELTPVKFEPLMVTKLDTGPLVGVKLVIVGDPAAGGGGGGGGGGVPLPDCTAYRYEYSSPPARMGAEVRRLTVGREARSRVGDLVAAVLARQVDLPGERARGGVPARRGSWLAEVGPGGEDERAVRAYGRGDR